MDFDNKEDMVVGRVKAIVERVDLLQDQDLYFYNQPIAELRGGARVLINGRDMGMYASYSYLGLIGHPRINKRQKMLSIVMAQGHMACGCSLVLLICIEN